VTKHLRLGLARWEAARPDHPGGIVAPRDALGRYVTLAALPES